MTRRFLSICALFFSILVMESFAQVSSSPPPPPPPTPSRAIVGNESRPGPAKIPGATVRGRLVYENTGAPIRYAMVGFSKVDSPGQASEFVKTDEKGDFEFNDLAPGDYYPVVRNRGILNPEAFSNTFLTKDERAERIAGAFQKISVLAGGEFQVFLRAKRGAAITGIVRYFDGEPAVGVKVEVIPVNDGVPESTRLNFGQGNGIEETDDRGVYRFSGLPQGVYSVRVTEPVSHDKIKGSSYFNSMTNPVVEHPFQTYFPGTPSIDNAEMFEVFYGRGAEGVNITLPERRLYDISGMVIRKDTRAPLRNFKVDFVPIAKEKNDDKDDADAESKNKLSKQAAGMFSGFGSSTNYGEPRPAEWSVTNLPNGKYRITATQQRQYRDPSEGAVPEVRRYPSVSKEVEIVDGNLENVLIEIPVGSKVGGTIAADDGAEIESFIFLVAIDEETGVVQRSNFNRPEKKEDVATTIQDFDFGVLLEGKYKLSFVGKGYYIRSVSVNGKAVPGNTIETEDGKDLENVRIVLASDLGILRGTVADFDPGDRTLIMLLRKGVDILTSFGSAGGSANVQADGTFEVKAAPGEYSVLVLRESERPQSPLQLVSLLEEKRNAAPTVVLAAKEIKNISLSLP